MFFECEKVSLPQKPRDFGKPISYSTSNSQQKALSLLPDNHIDRGKAYGIMGRVYRAKRMHDLSQDYYKKQLENCQQLLPNNHSDIGTAYTNLGNVCQDMGNYQKAIDCYKKALAINHKSLPPNHPTVKLAENNLRIVTRKLNRK
ncbi:unnamed protein product [Didymodactylos carnosus]|uniref:Kinesin light chain n=1 Tax=Didymodactylos carnosus TaxID=1234261 RepID=A0A815G486_9BILA|nr:unnamed protein product [Didymodactylos carnosus]CAF4190239.1 unnamed protein product [Didymodactylos carnosus]